jgi:hypothetical protein
MAKRQTRAERKMVPALLLSEVIGEDEHIAFEGVRLRRAHVIDIVDTFLGAYFQYKKQAMHLHSERLRLRYGMHYAKYLRYLETHDVIQLDANHQAGVQSRRYRLLTQWKHAEQADIYVEMPVSRSTKVIQENIVSPIDPAVRARLQADLRLVSLAPSAEEWLAKARVELVPTKYHRNRYTINKITEGTFVPRFCKYGRMHTPVTTLKREVRKESLRLGGEETVELDIGSSQPFFLFLWLLQRGFSDWNGFDEDVLEERLYRRIQEEGRFNSRDAAKRSTYRVLFGKSRRNAQNAVFAALYPAVWQALCDFKLREGNHAAVAHMLQRAESEFLFNRVIKQLIVDFPDMPIVTVHDSIIVPVSYKDRVEVFFEEQQHQLLLEAQLKANKKAQVI